MFDIAEKSNLFRIAELFLRFRRGKNVGWISLGLEQYVGVPVRREDASPNEVVKSAHSNVRGTQPRDMGQNRACHLPGVRDIVHQNFHRARPAAKLIQRLNDVRLHRQARFGVTIQHLLKGIERRIVNAIDERHVEMLAGGNVVYRDHFRHFQKRTPETAGFL